MLRRQVVVPLSLSVLMVLGCDSSHDSALAPQNSELSTSVAGAGQVTVWVAGQDAPMTIDLAEPLTASSGGTVQSVIAPDSPDRLSANFSALYSDEEDIGILFDALVNVSRKPSGEVVGLSSRTTYSITDLSMNPSPDDVNPYYSYSGPPACLEKVVSTLGNEAIVLAARLGEGHPGGWDATYNFISLDGSKVDSSALAKGAGVYENPCSESILDPLVHLVLDLLGEPTLSLAGRCTAANVVIVF